MEFKDLREPICHIPYLDIAHYREAIERYRYPLEVYTSASTLREVKTKEFISTGRYLRNLGIPVMMHAPFLEMTPGGFEPAFRILSEKILMAAVDAAIKLQARKIVAHLGFEPWKHEFNVNQWIDNAIATFATVIEALKPHRIELLLENVFEPDPSLFQGAFKRLEYEGLGFCLDVAHIELYSRSPAEKWVSELGFRLRHVHLSDHHGRSDEHLSLGRGSIDFAHYFELLRRSGIDPTFTFEFGGLQEIARSRELLHRLWRQECSMDKLEAQEE